MEHKLKIRKKCKQNVNWLKYASAIIQSQPLLKTILRNPPIIAYRIDRSLKDMPVKAKLSRDIYNHITSIMKESWRESVLSCLHYVYTIQIWEHRKIKNVFSLKSHKNIRTFSLNFKIYVLIKKRMHQKTRQ